MADLEKGDFFAKDQKVSEQYHSTPAVPAVQPTETVTMTATLK
jgi:hypothetical protein